MGGKKSKLVPLPDETPPQDSQSLEGILAVQMPDMTERPRELMKVLSSVIKQMGTSDEIKFIFYGKTRKFY